MARHADQLTTMARRTARIATAAGVVVAAGAAVAAPAVADADPVVDVVRTRPTSLGNIDPQAGLGALTGTVGYVTGPVAGLKPNPLAGTGVDPRQRGRHTAGRLQAAVVAGPDGAAGAGAVGGQHPGARAGGRAAALNEKRAALPLDGGEARLSRERDPGDTDRGPESAEGAEILVRPRF